MAKVLFRDSLYVVFPFGESQTTEVKVSFCLLLKKSKVLGNYLTPDFMFL